MAKPYTPLELGGRARGFKPRRVGVRRPAGAVIIRGLSMEKDVYFYMGKPDRPDYRVYRVTGKTEEIDGFLYYEAVLVYDTPGPWNPATKLIKLRRPDLIPELSPLQGMILEEEYKRREAESG